MPVKWLAIALGLVIAVLQYRLWLSDTGVRELARMQQAVTEQGAQNAVLVDRNRQLAAEVRDLKTGMAALEERARSELGMIAGNETYYQVVPAAPAAPRPTAAQVAAR
jgi:cell division protein FtsB